MGDTYSSVDDLSSEHLILAVIANLDQNGPVESELYCVLDKVHEDKLESPFIAQDLGQSITADLAFVVDLQTITETLVIKVAIGELDPDLGPIDQSLRLEHILDQCGHFHRVKDVLLNLKLAIL